MPNTIKKESVSIIEFMETQFSHYEEKQVLRDEVQRMRHESTEKALDELKESNENRFEDFDKRMDKLISFLKWSFMAIVAVAAVGVTIFATYK